MPAEDEARDAVRRGKTAVAVIIPTGFGDAAGKAFFGDGEKPALGCSTIRRATSSSRWCAAS